MIASIPTPVWAALIMAAFVTLSAIVMWLVRFPLEQPRDPTKSQSTEGDAEPGSRA